MPPNAAKYPGISAASSLPRKISAVDAGEWARNSPLPRSRSPTNVFALIDDEIVSGTSVTSGAKR